jgi:hypothetical protein
VLFIGTPFNNLYTAYCEAFVQKTPRSSLVSPPSGGEPPPSPRTPGGVPTASFATHATPSAATSRATPSSRAKPADGGGRAGGSKLLVAGGKKSRPTAAALFFGAARRILHSSLQSALASTVWLSTSVLGRTQLARVVRKCSSLPSYCTTLCSSFARLSVSSS